MKLIYAIIRKEDRDLLTEELNAQGFSVTRLSSTGGFLRKGNVTLMIGTEEEHVEEALEIIRRECGKRRQVVYQAPYPSTSGAGSNLYASAPIPLPVDMGGATIFVVDVEHFEKV